MTNEIRFPKTLVVVGLPDADADKIPKMKDFLLNKMKERGCADWVDCDVVADENGKSKGAAIITFNTEKDARKFYTEINAGFKFGKSPLGVVRIDDVEHTLEKDMTELQNASGSAFLVREKLQYYMQDERCREQLLIRHGNETTIAWLDPAESAPVIEYDGEREKAEGQQMTNGAASWSPRGSFMATLHPRGVSIWAGKECVVVKRFEHAGVSGVSFSPNEEFLMTWNGARHQNEENVSNAIRLWEVQTGALVAQYDCPVDTKRTAKFPDLCWSADSKYLAGIFGTMKFIEKEVVVHNVAPGFAAPQADPDESWHVEKASLMIFALPDGRPVTTLKRPTQNARVIAWSPRGARLAFWNCENGSQPSAIEIVALPDCRLLGSKNVFKAVDCKLDWHPRGEFLSALMRIASKSGKTFSPSLEILRTGEGLSRGVPVETFKLPAEATIKFLAWEPTAPRFVYMTEIEGHSRVRKLHLCSCRSDSTLEVAQLELAQPFNAVRWSPLGSHLAIGVFATRGQSLDGHIWHLQVHGGQSLQGSNSKKSAAAASKSAASGASAKDANPFLANSKAAGETPSRIEILQTNKNFMLNSLDWDDSGRFLLASVRLDALTNASRYVNETGYCVYSFQGKLVLNESKKSHLKSVQFRPHPHNMLADEQVEAVRRDVKSFAKRFEAIDDAKRNEQLQAYNAARQTEQDAFDRVLKSVAEFKAQKLAAKVKEWEEAARAFEAKKSYREVAVEVEEVVEVIEEIVEEEEEEEKEENN
eukprot:GDKJ01042759.1.p1 GENE.GDKJ01042759.1~~GDKJ01042759.1.p1  ORF type:complete len:761 (-),score=201.02 GDKJ01042759.1:207-2489(-)